MVSEPSNEWEVIQPSVNAEAEFFEILNDFGNPLELLREAISNAVDAGASYIKISFTVEDVDGAKRLIIRLEDDGLGMTREILSRDFWGLGYSPSRKMKLEGKSDAIGEKGHGTKIYLRSEKVIVRTQSSEGAYHSECDRPLSNLTRGRLHEPRVRSIPNFQTHTGTHVEIIGYNDNVRSKFIQSVVKDYIIWFTKIGSVEQVFGIDKLSKFKVFLRCLDEISEEISFGHVFPAVNSDIDKLFNEHGTSAADLYANNYIFKQERLRASPEVTFDVVIYVEGDTVKRQYNPMIRERIRPGSDKYRVSDRYGIWLCKDYIPIVRINDWITGFGSGSNAIVLLHGFVNCQSLKLTANRGTIANTDPEILEELKSSINDIVKKIDLELDNKGLHTLKNWQDEDRTMAQEKSEFDRRVKNLRKQKVAKFGNVLLLEPRNESELFGLFMSIYSLHPELFEFQPLDYNTSRGIDIIARNKGIGSVSESEYWYVELKYMLTNKKFNHSFGHLRWIICWDFDEKSITIGVKLQGIEEGDERRLVMDTDDNDNKIYFLDNKKRPIKIQIIRLKEFLRERLELEFELRV